MLRRSKNDISLKRSNLLFTGTVIVAANSDSQNANATNKGVSGRWCKKRVAAGAAPELDALTLEGQYATDSASYITAKATADQNLLQLKQVLNIDAGKLFDIATPPVEHNPGRTHSATTTWNGITR